jgi:hypothetical protein
MAEIDRLADNMVLLDKGHLVACGPLSELQSNPSLPLATSREAAVTLQGVVTACDPKFGLSSVSVPGAVLIAPPPPATSVGRPGCWVPSAFTLKSWTELALAEGQNVYAQMKIRVAQRWAGRTRGREAMARNLTVTHGKTRLDVKCGKCGAPNRVTAEMGQSRVKYTCKECAHKQSPTWCE